MHWSSKIPLRYKRSTITGELQRVNRTASNVSNEIKRIKIKYLQVGFPIHIVNVFVDLTNRKMKCKYHNGYFMIGNNV